jgi:hypothetical protein
VNLNQLLDSALALGTQLLQQVQNPFFGVITDPTSPLSRQTVQLGQSFVQLHAQQDHR